MEARKYTQPSARSRAFMRRNTLNVLDEQEDTSWLNDVSPAALSTSNTTQQHMVTYEDMPTMPLTFLKPTQISVEEQKTIDDDKTVRLNSRNKEHMVNITISFPEAHKRVDAVQVRFVDGTFYTIKAALY